jgi:cytochrome c oxidase subunit 2
VTTLLELLPIDASSVAPRFDELFWFVCLVTGVVAILIAGFIVVFAVRYRRGSRADRSNAPPGYLPLEITWIAVPFAIFIAFFAWAGGDYANLYRPPADAMPVFVVAKQWMWKVQHENGRREIDELHVPVGRPVRLVMTSEDAVHSLFVPAFRIKQDVVPGRYTSVWFTATRAGEYRLFCAEYCGSWHARMLARVVAMAPERFARWLEEGGPATGMVARGGELFRRYGCSGCHAGQSSVHAPELGGLIGRRVNLQDGRSLVADEAYIRDSILLPRKDVVAGYRPIMPSFAGQISEEDLMALIEYLRSTDDGRAG